MIQQTTTEPAEPNCTAATEVDSIPFSRRLVASLRRRIIQDNPALGLLVELRGNQVSVGPLKFDVSDPCIHRGIKARFVLGAYERPEIDSIHRELDRSIPVVELGACLGVVSCVTNSLLADPQKHVVVEANPRLVPVIERNRALNDGRFELINAALAYHQESVTFYVGKLVTASALRGRKGEPITVPAITLSQILHDRQFERANLIVDIEGAEYDLVTNELETLSRHAARIFMEVHENVLGARKLAEVFTQLARGGFELIERTADNCVFKNTALGE